MYVDIWISTFPLLYWISKYWYKYAIVIINFKIIELSWRILNISKSNDSLNYESQVIN